MSAVEQSRAGGEEESFTALDIYINELEYCKQFLIGLCKSKHFPCCRCFLELNVNTNYLQHALSLVPIQQAWSFQMSRESQGA